MASADIERILQSLEEHNSVADADLSGVNFQEVSLEGAHFENCTAGDARFVGGDLPMSTWIGCRFSACGFSSTKFSGASFKNCTFFDSERTGGTEFRFCEFKDATFENCNLSIAAFFVCGLFDVKFSGCGMRGVTFEKPSFAHSLTAGSRSKTVMRMAGTFENCNLGDAILREADFSSCTLTDCKLDNADLNAASFVNSSLRGSDLRYASLRRVNFTGTDLRGADLTGFDLNEVESYSGMQISAGQQHHLLRSIGIDVYPEGE